MKPWQLGDPVGMGEVYLPDKKTRAAYGKACRAAVIDSAAKHAINLPTLDQRREFINRYPAAAREALKDRIKELWEAKHV
jgi:hypothetical protein